MAYNIAYTADPNKRGYNPKGETNLNVTKFTPEAIQVIAASIRKGNTLKNSCNLAGVSVPYFHNLISKIRKYIAQCEDSQEDPDPANHVYVNENLNAVKLYRAVIQAESDLENSLVETWMGLRHTDWKASKEFLARRFSKDWGEVSTKKVQLSGPDGGAIQVKSMDLSQLTAEELERFEQLLTKIPQPGDDTDGES